MSRSVRGSTDSIDAEFTSLNLNHRATSLFNLLDPTGTGYIDQQALAECCGNLTSGEIRTIFSELDADNDGQINLQDFQEGFKTIGIKMAQKERHRLGSLSQSNSSISQLKAHSQEQLLDIVGEEEQHDSVIQTPLEDHLQEETNLEQLTCHDQVCEMYKTLQTEYPHLVNSFESIILQVMKDVDNQKKEKARLEESFKREKEQNELYLKQLEEDMEIQFSKMEIRIRAKERQKLEAEYEKTVYNKMSEINDLQKTIASLQHQTDEYNEQMASTDLKNTIETIQMKNHKLALEMQELETALVLSKGELCRLRTNHDSKCSELEKEKRALLDYIKEQDKLTHQLHLLHDANRKLHDTNDDLRAALEAKTPSSGRGTFTRTTSCASERISVCDVGYSREREVILPANDTCEEDNLDGIICGQDEFDHDQDSGTSTFRDPPDDFPDHFIIPYQGMSRNSSYPEDYDDDFYNNSSLASRNTLINRPTSLSLRQYSSSDEEYDDISYRRRPKSRNSGRHPRSYAVTPASAFQSPTAVGPPERMFKIVLAGDAAVGKSSFIMRFCEGRFTGNLVSTLGVDFKTKTVEVDGHVVAIQLWDTAGQERFRSIAKSYFRRADGVILLYDVTYAKSFLNVREWVESIEDCAEQGTPLMIVANKVDLREEVNAGGVRTVSHSEGKKMAQEHNALFIEVSAKSGLNVHEAMIELARLLRTQEDLAVNNIKLKLNDHEQDTDKSKTNCCSFV